MTLNRWIAFAALAAALAPAAARAEGPDAQRVILRTYSGQYMTRPGWTELESAACAAETEQCRVESFLSDSSVRFSGLATAHERFAALLKDANVAPRSFVFRIQVMVEDGQDAPPAKLPAAAARALRDLEELLPGRKFAPLDAAQVRSVSRADLRLSGAEGEGYLVRFNFRGKNGDDKLYVEEFEIYRGVISAERRILATSFSISLGETLVVGTSKTASGKAFVVLLTALP